MSESPTRQESGLSVAAAMEGMDVDEVEATRSNSELLRAAEELEAEIAADAAGNKKAVHSGAASGSGVVAGAGGAAAEVDATGKCASSDGDSSDEDEDDAAAAARLAFDEEMKKVIAAGRAAGFEVKKKAAEFFVEELDLLVANDKTIVDCARSDGSKKIYKQDVVMVVDELKKPPEVLREESEWAATQESVVSEEEEDDWLEGKSIKELTEMQVEKQLELEGIEKKLESGAMAMVFKEFARGAKKESNATELKALSDKVKLEVEKPFFKGLGKVGHELMVKVHTAAIEEGVLPAAADGLRVELTAIKSAKAAAKAAKEEAKEAEELQKMMEKKRVAQASGAVSKQRRKS